MGKYLLLLSFLFLTLMCTAQKYTVQELIKLYEHDNNFFDTYVVQKGYFFSGNSKDKIKYDYKDRPVFNSISVNYYNNKFDTSKLDRNIFWVFISDTTYLEVKKELFDLGYNVYDEVSTENGSDNYHHFLYRNSKSNLKNYIVELIVGKRAIFKIPMYYVNISESLTKKLFFCPVGLPMYSEDSVLTRK